VSARPVLRRLLQALFRYWLWISRWQSYSKPLYNTLYPDEVADIMRNSGGRRNDDREKVIIFKNVVKRFGERIVLDNISIAIEKGKTTVIIGPSGWRQDCNDQATWLCLLRPTSGRFISKISALTIWPNRELDEIRTHFGFFFRRGRCLTARPFIKTSFSRLCSTHKKSATGSSR